MGLDCCSLCLQRPIFDVCVSLLSDSEESNKLLSDLFLCTQIVLKLERNSLYPVCNACINDLFIANTFRMKCVAAQEFLLNYSSQNLTQSTLESSGQSTNQKAKLETSSYSSDFYGNKPKDIPNKNNNDSENRYKDIDTENADNHVNSLFQCDICSKILKSNKSLVLHKTVMHVNRKHIGKVTGFGLARRYYCKECPYSSPHSQTLVNHVRRHSGEKPYICECGKSFTQSSALAAHQKTHSSDANFICTICGKQLKLAHSLKRHMRVHKNGCLSCPHCQKKLKSKESLEYHIRRHKNIRNYSCEECGRMFVTSSELINHKKMHNAEKFMKCNFCFYETNKRKSLVIHLQRHTGIKTVKCSICEAAFFTSSELRSHQRVHTRVKPYHCPLCAQHFTHSSSVNKHVRTVHGKQFKWCMR